MHTTPDGERHLAISEDDIELLPLITLFDGFPQPFIDL